MALKLPLLTFLLLSSFSYPSFSADDPDQTRENNRFMIFNLNNNNTFFEVFQSDDREKFMSSRFIVLEEINNCYPQLTPISSIPPGMEIGESPMASGLLLRHHWGEWEEYLDTQQRKLTGIILPNEERVFLVSNEIAASVFYIQTYYKIEEQRRLDEYIRREEKYIREEEERIRNSSYLAKLKTLANILFPG